MKKKVNILIILSFLFILMLGGAYSYSKYVSDVTGVASADVANWNITVNNCNIVNPDKNNATCFDETIDDVNNTVTLNKNFNIEDFSYSNNNNPNVVDNKIAPGSSGVFELVIKPNDTEVSLKYTLKVSLKDENDSIRIFRSSPNSNDKVEMEVDGYQNLILYDENNVNYEEKILIYIDWINDESGVNDEKDTLIGTSGSVPKLEIPVEIVFEQYMG